MSSNKPRETAQEAAEPRLPKPLSPSMTRDKNHGQGGVYIVKDGKRVLQERTRAANK